LSAPLSILHVALSNGFGGSERYAVDLAGKQAALGHRVAIVGRKPKGESLFDHLPQGVGGYEASRFFPSRAIAQAVKALNADVVHAHLPDSARAIRHLKKRPPAVMSLHLRFKPSEFRGMDGMVRVAHWQEKETAAYHGAAVTALNWPPALAPADHDAIAAARRELGAHDNMMVVGFLARLHRVKRADVLIDAWRQGAPPNAILAFIGDGPERAALEKRAKDLPDIRFLGHRTDMGVWHRAIDMFALTSDWEGLPLGVLEAMSLSTPILATACTGTAEVLEGSHAMLVPPGDVAGLADNLAAAQSRFAAGKLGREAYDLSRFDPAIALAQIESLYRQVLGSN
jgi:glycosyltransferase involved in cell wall biosynthesis